MMSIAVTLTLIIPIHISSWKAKWVRKGILTMPGESGFLTGGASGSGDSSPASEGGLSWGSRPSPLGPAMGWSGIWKQKHILSSHVLLAYLSTVISLILHKCHSHSKSMNTYYGGLLLLLDTTFLWLLLFCLWHLKCRQRGSEVGSNVL